jgi:hypothetical protein
MPPAPVPAPAPVRIQRSGAVGERSASAFTRFLGPAARHPAITADRAWRSAQGLTELGMTVQVIR